MENKTRYIRLLTYEEGQPLINFIRSLEGDNDAWVTSGGIQVSVSDGYWMQVLEYLNTHVSRYEVTDQHPEDVNKKIVNAIGFVGEGLSGVIEKDSNSFPNGFTSWHETHFEIVQAIIVEYMKDEPSGPVKERHEASGHGGLYELAQELTDEFEKKYEGVVWGVEIEFFDTIEEFIEEKGL